MRFWTDEETAKLKAWWEEGLSAQACADRLGRERNAVCGKLHRLGLGGQRVTVNGPGEARRPGRSRRAVPFTRAPAETLRQAQDRAHRAAAEEDAAALRARLALELGARPEGLRLVDARPAQCRWPVGGEGAFLVVCGAPVATRVNGRPGPYCPACAALAYDRQAAALDVAERNVVWLADRCHRAPSPPREADPAPLTKVRRAPR